MHCAYKVTTAWKINGKYKSRTFILFTRILAIEHVVNLHWPFTLAIKRSETLREEGREMKMDAQSWSEYYSVVLLEMGHTFLVRPT